MSSQRLFSRRHENLADDKSAEAQVRELSQAKKPRFYRGQLLEDADLNALMSWASEKASLQRYRTGWGAVKGLQVAAHPNIRDSIIVRAGYGVNASGHDVVVPKDYVFSLREACYPGPDPCPRESKDRKGSFSPGSKSCPPQGLELLGLDLYLRFAEQNSDPEPVFMQSDSRARQCSYSRTVESFQVVAMRSPGYVDTPGNRQFDRWSAAYARYLERLREFASKFESAEEVFTTRGSLSDEQERFLTEMIRHLKDWIEEEPPERFGFLRDCVCAVPEKDAGPYLMHLLFFLVQDRRCALLAEARGEGDEMGIPLAKIWMRRLPSGDCALQYIDDVKPARREISTCAWPAPQDQHSLAPYLWSRAEARGSWSATLRKASYAREPWAVPSTPRALLEFLESEVVTADCDEELTVHWMYGSRPGKKTERVQERAVEEQRESDEALELEFQEKREQILGVEDPVEREDALAKLEREVREERLQRTPIAMPAVQEAIQERPVDDQPHQDGVDLQMDWIGRRIVAFTPTSAVGEKRRERKSSK